MTHDDDPYLAGQSHGLYTVNPPEEPEAETDVPHNWAALACIVGVLWALSLVAAYALGRAG